MKDKNNIQLYETDSVIYNKKNDDVVKFTDGEIVIYGDKEEAEADCRRGEVVIPCTELPNHWKEILLEQIANQYK